MGDGFTPLPLPAHRLAGARGVLVCGCVLCCVVLCVCAPNQTISSRPTLTNPTPKEGLRLSIEVSDGDFSLYSAEGPIKVGMLGFGCLYMYI